MDVPTRIILALGCDITENCNECIAKYKKAPCNVHRQLYRTSLREFMKNEEYKAFKEKLRRI